MDEQTKLSRRSMLRGAVLLAGGTLAAGVIQVKPAHAQGKAAKEAVKYQDSPKDGQQCSACLYFQAPGSCAVVDGAISPSGWCSLYNKK
jgi:hypothetical protein